MNHKNNTYYVYYVTENVHFMRINAHVRFYCWGCHSKYIQISASDKSALGVITTFQIHL